MIKKRFQVTSGEVFFYPGESLRYVLGKVHPDMPTELDDVSVALNIDSDHIVEVLWSPPKGPEIRKKLRDVATGEVFRYPGSTYIFHQTQSHFLNPYRSIHSDSGCDSDEEVIVVWSPPKDQKHADVVAPGPTLSSTEMLDDAARALGWRTDFAGGGSPITWDLVLQEIKKLRTAKKVDDTPDHLKKLDQVLKLAGQMYEHAREPDDCYWNSCDPNVRALWIQIAMLSS